MIMFDISSRTIFFMTAVFFLITLLSSGYLTAGYTSLPSYWNANLNNNTWNRSSQRHVGSRLHSACARQTSQKVRESACSNSTIRNSMLRINETQPIPSKYLYRIKLQNLQKLLYCQVPKAASTAWNYMLGVAALHATDKFKKTKEQNIILRWLHKFPAEDAEKKLHDPEYLKFIVVRHPLERLISGYQQKFLDKNYKQTEENMVKLLLKQQKLTSEPRDQEALTFREFLEFLVMDKYKLKSEALLEFQNDIHWRRQVDLCHPCYINYDYIIHMESMDRDAQYILQRLNSSYIEQMNKSPVENIFHTNPFDSLPEKLVQNVIKKYEADFKVFGYNYEPYSRMTDCRNSK